MDELVILTHNDMDALGCILNINFKFPDVPKKFFITNYVDIDKIIGEMEEFIGERSPTIILTDVSFSTNVAALRGIISISKGRVYVIDHHRYPVNFWDEFKDSVFLVLDENKSAAELCNQFLKNAGKNPNLDAMTKIIGTFDIWVDDSPIFPLAQDVNDYFIQMARYNTLEGIADVIIGRGYKFPENFRDVVFFNKQKCLHDMEDQSNIYRFGEITVVYVKEWFNQILEREFVNGQNFVIGVYPLGLIKIRINKKAPYSQEIKSKICYLLCGSTDKGHLEAFSFMVEGAVNVQSILNTAERATKTIIQVINDKGI